MIKIYLTITGVFALEFIILIIQQIRLRRILRSQAWTDRALGFFLIGSTQVWQFVRLPSQIRELEAKGIPIPPITVETWIVVAAIFLGLAELIKGNRELRRDITKAIHITKKPKPPTDRPINSTMGKG